MEIWNGYQAGVDGAIEIMMPMKRIQLICSMEEIIDKLLNKQRLYISCMVIKC